MELKGKGKINAKAFGGNPFDVFENKQGGQVATGGRDVARGGAMLRTLDGILSDWGSHQGTESKGLAWSDLCVERIS